MFNVILTKDVGSAQICCNLKNCLSNGNVIFPVGLIITIIISVIVIIIIIIIIIIITRTSNTTTITIITITII